MALKVLYLQQAGTLQPVVQINTADPPIFTCYCDINGPLKATNMTQWCETPLLYTAKRNSTYQLNHTL